MKVNEITENVIGSAIEVHKALGAGLLESVYELALRGISFKKQFAVSLAYKDVVLDAGYKLDLFVEDAVVAELKTVEKILPIHDVQILTYMKLVQSTVGLLITLMFHVYDRALDEKY